MGESISTVGDLAGVCGHDGTDWIKVLVDEDGKLQIEIDVSALPEGAATEETLQAVRDRIGALTSPAAGSTNKLLTDSLAALQLIDNLRAALNSVATDELDVVLDGQNADVEVTQTTPADLTVAQHQYDGAAWRKSNLLWGYNDVVSEDKSDTNLGAGSQSVVGTSVPSGEVWTISAITGQMVSGSIDRLSVAIHVDGVDIMLNYETNPTSAAIYLVTGQFVLKEDDYVFLYLTNCTAGDDGYLKYAGYKLDINM